MKLIYRLIIVKVKKKNTGRRDLNVSLLVFKEKEILNWTRLLSETGWLFQNISSQMALGQPVNKHQFD